MPILTPAYPCMNSSASVSGRSLDIMKDEFERGWNICKKIMKDPDPSQDKWAELFEPSDFFIKYNNYLAVCTNVVLFFILSFPSINFLFHQVDVFASSEAEQAAWCGFVESRLRRLVEAMGWLPLSRIQNWPSKMKAYSKDCTQHSACFYIGFEPDKKKMKGTQINLSTAIGTFQDKTYKWAQKVDGMDMIISSTNFANLPDEVFESLGGKEEAKEARRKRKAARDAEAEGGNSHGVSEDSETKVEKAVMVMDKGGNTDQKKSLSVGNGTNGKHDSLDKPSEPESTNPPSYLEILQGAKRHSDSIELEANALPIAQQGARKKMKISMNTVK